MTEHENLCNMRQDYLSSRLSQSSSALFAEHLELCGNCRKEISFWENLSPKFDEWKNSFDAPNPSMMEIQRLVREVSGPNRTSTETVAPVWKWAFAASCVAAALTLAIWWQPIGDDSTGNRRSINIFARADKADDPTGIESSLNSTVLSVDNVFDNLGDSPKLQSTPDGEMVLLSQAQVAGLSLSGNTKAYRVNKGKALFNVVAASREKNKEVAVQVLGHSIQVFVAQFSVEIQNSQQVEVFVKSGELDVQTASGQTAKLVSSDRLVLNSNGQSSKETIAAHSLQHFEKFPKNNSLSFGSDGHRKRVRSNGGSTRSSEPLGVFRVDDIKQRLVAGDLEGVENDLTSYLKRHAANGSAWLLLGDCQRKQKNWKASVTAYEKAIKFATGRQQSRAMFQVANIYQQNLNKDKLAIEFYNKYIKSKHATSSLLDVARLKMATSLISVGQKERAKTELNKVIKSQNKGYLAENARKLLEGL